MILSVVIIQINENEWIIDCLILIRECATPFTTNWTTTASSHRACASPVTTWSSAKRFRCPKTTTICRAPPNASPNGTLPLSCVTRKRASSIRLAISSHLLIFFLGFLRLGQNFELKKVFFFFSNFCFFQVKIDQNLV